MLKQFIDVVSQPGWIFGVDPVTGYQHLLAGRGKKVAVIYTSAVWGPALGPEFGSNFQSTYFDDWLRWTGLTDISEIRFHPTLTGDRAARTPLRRPRPRHRQDVLSSPAPGAAARRWPSTASAARRPETRAPCWDGVSRWSPATNRPSPSATGLRNGRPAGNAGSAARTSSTRRSSQPRRTRRRSAPARGGSRAPVPGRTDDRRRHQRATGRGVALGHHDGVRDRPAGAVEVQQRRVGGRGGGRVVVGG